MGPVHAWLLICRTQQRLLNVIPINYVLLFAKINGMFLLGLCYVLLYYLRNPVMTIDLLENIASLEEAIGHESYSCKQLEFCQQLNKMGTSPFPQPSRQM